MSCEIRHEGDTAIVALIGDIDLESSPKVRTALLDCVGLKQGVLVDMSDVSYIDSSGVASRSLITSNTLIIWRKAH